jgi:ferredoxin
MTTSQLPDSRFLPKLQLDRLIQFLRQDGYEVIGPRLDQGAIVHAPVASAQDLPIGWTERQSAGTYRLEQRGDNACFGFAVGPHSWKKYLFPPVLSLWRAKRTDDGFQLTEGEADPPPRAFLGVRSCDLHAIGVQDRVFRNRAGQFTDPHYARGRERLFLVAVECEHPGGTCFCASMGTGPAIRTDRVSLPLTSAPAEDNAVPAACDLVLTELDDGFVVRAGSEAGRRLLERLSAGPATAAQVDEGQRRVAAAAGAMGRTVDVSGIHGLLHRNQEHPRWDEVAQRCLACTNCTLVCPTCFCSSVTDVSDLALENAERVRSWDSCFNPEFARVHGGNYRPSIPGRYRQWLTHKFASWYDQFDVSGCVGCGRCITWCPVGIDVTEEIAAIRASDGRRKEELG